MSEPSAGRLPFERRPLLVLALGGNALSPPAASGDGYAAERDIVAATAARLNRLTAAGQRLLIVHGNGPQVGRLLRQDPAHGNLDLHIAQTQGELGYLLCANLDQAAACVLTRVLVADDPGPPIKPIGPVRAVRPERPAVRSGSGWRLIVPSPRPIAVLEADVVARLLETHHVIAAGGGGVPVDSAGRPVTGVVDKDPVAARLAVDLNAAGLVFATDVAGVYADPHRLQGPPLPRLSVAAARDLIAAGRATAGAMAPKVESAAAFAAATGRQAVICGLEQIEAALSGGAGTRIG